MRRLPGRAVERMAVDRSASRAVDAFPVVPDARGGGGGDCRQGGPCRRR